MRRTTASRLMWIDAICIDQEDSTEKSQQVKLMGEIFARAESVAVWLGDHHAHGFTEDEAQAAFNVIAMIANNASRVVNIPKDRVSAALLAITDSPWWLRSWTVQEIVLASSAVVIWGSVSTPWITFQAAAEVLVGSETPELPFEEPLIFDGHRFTAPIMGIKYLMARRATDPKGDSQLQILWRIRHRSSTDPRDKNFAAASLLPADSKIKADYSLGTVQLYEKTTLDLIRSSRTLDCLLGYRGEEKQIPGLPSWVAGWTQPLDPLARTSRCWRHFFGSYYFSADTGLAISDTMYLNEQFSTLSLESLQVDRVKVVGKATMQVASPDYGKDISLKDTQATITRWKALADRIFKESFSNIHLADWEDSFWRTMAGDLIFYTDVPSQRAKPFHRQLYDDFLLSDDPESMDIEGEIYHTYSCHVVNQAFFITEKGLMGTVLICTGLKYSEKNLIAF